MKINYFINFISEICFGVCEITVYFQNAGMAKKLKAAFCSKQSGGPQITACSVISSVIRLT